jgi:hypothetical protein
LKNEKFKFDETNRETKIKLDSVSPSFCLAKWTQTTLHLGLGHTHSCHHPRTHKISLEKLKNDPSTLHNTDFKKSARKEMLLGVRPQECEYCWKVEDLTDSKQYSDRILKSSYDWSLPFLQEVITAGADHNINPKYLEVSFSNVCNFKCSYCMPSVSSQWMEEIERHGPYPTSMKYNNLDWVKEQDKFPIPVREYNPYIEAFWKWFPNLINDLHTFRITGGEPLLDKNLFKVLDYLIENPVPTLEFSINSNFDVPKNIFEMFLNKINQLINNKSVKTFTVYTSCEAHGASAEYIRYGLNYQNWKNNVLTYLNTIQNPLIGIMSTYNCLSVTTYKDFLEDILYFKKIAFVKNGKLSLDIPYLNHPYHLSIKILTDDFIGFFNEQHLFCLNNLENDEIAGFNDVEIFKLLRVKRLFEQNTPEFNLFTNRLDFYKFIDEHDKRRNTNFKLTFPLMIEFYQFCKSL